MRNILPFIFFLWLSGSFLMVSCSEDSTSNSSTPPTDGDIGTDSATHTGSSAHAGSATDASSTSGHETDVDTEPQTFVESGSCESGDFEIRELGETVFMGDSYRVVAATPCEYVLSHVRRNRSYNVADMGDFYVVDSHFELPYIEGVMDHVAFTPEPTGNNGWALGADVESIVAELGPMPFLYHVRPGYAYGYFTDYNDGLGDIFGAFRPTWRFAKDGNAVVMNVFSPPDEDWPRHRGGWNPREINQEIGFGLFVDEDGKVYVPKNIPLARKKWADDFRCVMINKTDQPVSVTRTQFPGDESYYMAETLLPGFASIGSPGHRYWGHKGKTMREVAKWDDTLPGNFDKPFGMGCSLDGYDVGHTEGFTWPKLREEMRDKYLAGEREAFSSEKFYRIKVYRSEDAGQIPRLLGELYYEWDGDEWLPKAEGDSLISIDSSRNTYRISGYLPEGQHAWIVVENL